MDEFSHHGRGSAELAAFSLLAVLLAGAVFWALIGRAIMGAL